MGRATKEHFEFESIHLSEHGRESQYRQLEDQLRRAIASRRIPTGTRIPSSRRLSQILKVSRNTVLAAYGQLISEGYLESVHGSGTRVAAFPPEAFEFANPIHPRRIQPPFTDSLSTSGKALRKLSAWLPDAESAPRPFRPHLPDVEAFPLTSWNRLVNEQSKWSVRSLHAADPQGYLPLRQSIAQYMAISRGVDCTAEQVVITAGAQQGLSMVTQVLLEPEDVAWVEEPGNAPAVQQMGLEQIRTVPMPVDEEGICIPPDLDSVQPPKLIYVTPSGQWPLAMTMSLNRRLDLLQVAQRYKSWVIEDDYNGEYRYTGRPHPALSSLDQTGRTLYMGSFSKLLYPAIRLGFLVVPERLSRTFACARWLQDRYSPPLQQMALHRFIESGMFLKHIRRMRSLYLERQSFLQKSLLQHFSDDIRVTLPESGMHLVVRGVNQKVEQRLITSATKAGVEHHTVRMYAQHPNRARGIILGFAAFDQQSMADATRAWSRAYAKPSSGTSLRK